MALQFGSPDHFYNGTSFWDGSTDRFCMGASVNIDAMADNTNYTLMNVSTTATLQTHQYELRLRKVVDGPSVGYEVRFVIRSGGSSLAIIAAPAIGPFPGQWINIAANNTSITDHDLWVNGILEASSSTSIDPLITDSRWTVGARKIRLVTAQYFPGRICSAFFYSREVEDEILASIGKYAISPLFYQEDAIPSQLVVHTPMIEDQRDVISNTSWTVVGATTLADHNNILVPIQKSLRRRANLIGEWETPDMFRPKELEQIEVF